MSFVTVKVPLFTPAYRNVDETELTDKSYILNDAYVNEMGSTVKRPGLSTFVDIGLGSNRPVSGLFWWPQKECVIAVVNDYVAGKIYKITYSAGTVTATDVTTNGPGVGTPTFSTGNDSNVSTPTLYGILAGTRPAAPTFSKGTGTTVSNFAYIADADCPTSVSHLAYIDGYVLMSNNTNRFFWCDLNAPEAFTASSYASAVGNPDYISALKIVNRLIYLFGPLTTEIWENDGQSPFSRVANGFIETGIGAPHSVVIDESTIYWLNHERHFVAAQGNNIKRFSTPYDKEISSFSSVSDCLGARIEIDGQPFLVFQFPTVARCLVYNIARQEWHEWRYWNETTGEYEAFLGQSHCYVPTWGKHLIGSRKASVIYELTPSTKTDAGGVIRTQRRSGHIDYGTLARKRSRELRLRVKRGEGGASATPKLVFRWRDNNRVWSNEHHVSLGDLGESEHVVRLRPMGIFRTRQYEITMTDAVSLNYGAAEEDIEVLG